MTIHILAPIGCDLLSGLRETAILSHSRQESFEYMRLLPSSLVKRHNRLGNFLELLMLMNYYYFYHASPQSF